jgi:hypothetical protein
MQVTQLAYHYACGTSVDALTNINSKDLPSGNDQQAFEKSIEVLNAKYNTYFTQLNANLSKYMAPFTNKERYTVVNNIFDGLSFLNSTYFNTADSADNSCGVTKLNFKNLGTSDKKNFGVLSMNTSCYTKDAKYPYHDYKFEIPYVLTDAKKVKSIAINKIGFSKESDIPIYSRPSGTADLTADDIANIGSKDDTICSSFWLDDCKSVYHWAEDINFFGVNSNVKYMGYSTGVNIKPETGSAYVLFADKVGRKSIDDQADWVKNLFFYHDSKVEPLEYQSSSDQLHRNGPPANPTISHYVSDLNHDHQYQEYAFATYNGKTFLVKLITEHKGETNAKTRVSIGCLSDANGCRRLDAKSTDSKDEINKGTVLYWNDGTSVRLYVKDNGASSYTHASLRNPYVYIGGTNVGGAVRSPHEVGSKADGSVCPTGEEVITDKATNLMWVRKPKSATYNWSDAQLPPAIPTSYCGYTDWRLPSKDEMKGLINQAEAGGGAWVHYANWFNTIGGFSGIGTSDKYWISTKHPVSGWAFYAMLETGDSSIPGHASESLKVLPVRSIK